MNRFAAKQDLLEDIEDDLQIQRDATSELRFVNYIVDLLCFYAVMVGFFFLIALTAYGPNVFQAIENMSDISDFVLLHVLYGLYMLAVEGLFKGKTLGKLITRTRVVRLHTTTFGWRDAIGRGLIRMIPLEYFTAFTGSPFHDQWTNTRVIKEYKKTIPRKKGYLAGLLSFQCHKWIQAYVR